MMVPVPLINIGPIGPGAFDTSALNREESYTLNIIRGDRRNGTGQAITNIADGSATFRKPVDNIGSKSIPQYATYANNHIYDIAIPGCDNGRVFVGQRKDSFVVNLGENVRSRQHRNPLGAENGEADDLADKNVTSFILEVPIACLVASASQPIIGGWTTASLGVGPVNRSDRARRRAPRARPRRNGRPTAGIDVGAGSELLRLGAGQPSSGARGSAVRLGSRPRQARRCRASVRRSSTRSSIGLKDKDLFNSASPTQDCGARRLRHESDAAGAARDPVRRCRRPGAEQLPARAISWRRSSPASRA